MRVVSPHVEYLLSLPDFQTFYLFSIEGNEASYKFTSYFTDLNIPGLGIFLSDHSIISFEPPIMEKATNRDAYKLVFGDPHFAWRSVAESNLLGTVVEMYMGVINTTGANFGNAAPDAPLLALDDLTLGFSGVIDARTYAIDPLEQSAVFTIECASPMASLGIKKPYYTSKEAMKQIDPTDTAYDAVYKGSASIGLLWGKA